MTILWGAWNTDSPTSRLRAGIEMSMSPSTVGAGTTTVTITTKCYLQTRYASYETGGGNNWDISGDVSAAGHTDWNLGDMGYKLMGTDTQNFSTSHTSTNKVDATAHIHSNYAYSGVDASVTSSFTIPLRPYSVPAAPSGVSATRNNDGQITVNWTRNATTDAPYTSMTLQMRTYTGGSWSSYSTVASPSGSATSYVKNTGLSANHKYQFQIRANNTAGSSGYVATGEVYMTPGAPTTVASQLNPSGTSITTTWVNTAYTSGTITHEIQRSVAGGAYSDVQTGIAQGTLTWQDNSPGAGTNKYRVASRTSTGSLLSGYAEGNTVSTTVAPLAPTNLSPSGVAVDLASTNVVLTWQHNPGGDGAPQTHYTVETSDDNGANWDALSGATDVASATASHTITAATLANGADYLWRVRTEGVVSAGYGPNSASGTFTGSAIPVVTLISGSPPATLNALPLTAAWNYAQDQSSPQAEYEALLLNAGGTEILESITGSGTTGTVDFTYPLVTGTSYLVKVRARSAAGLWGNYAEQAVDFALLPPAPIDLVATFNVCTGQMNLNLTPQAPEANEVAADFAKIERRVDGGDWVVLTQSVAVPTDFSDPLPLTNGLNEYRITSISTSPSYLLNAVVEASGTDGTPGSKHWILLNWGDGFGTVLRFQGNPSTGSASGRKRAAQEFLGREKSVLLLGDNTSYGVSASGDIRFDSTCVPTDLAGCAYDSATREWETAGKRAGIVAYRDYTGRRLFGLLSTMDARDKDWPGIASVSFSVTETDFTEGYV